MGKGGFTVAPLDKDLQTVGVGVLSFGDGYAGVVPIGQFGELVEVRFLKVGASGEWTVDLLAVQDLEVVKGLSFSGSGDTVVQYNGTGGAFHIVSEGNGGFVVTFDDGGIAIPPILEFGTYDGKQPVPSGAIVIKIDSDGKW